MGHSDRKLIFLKWNMSNSLALAVRGRSSDGISQPRVISDHPSSPFISEIEHCREKRYRQKLYGFEGDIRWYYWFDLEELLDGHMKVIFNFLNRTYYLKNREKAPDDKKRRIFNEK